MKIVVIGAGALGGLVGAHLTEAGEEVVLVEINQARARLLNETGLFISEGIKGERCVRLRVVTSVADLEPADLVFVSVKSYQTEAAVKDALPIIGPKSYVLSMQNGIGNTEIMAEILGAERVLSGITYHSIQHTGPNRIRYRPGIKAIQIAPKDGRINPAVEAVGEVFRNAGLATEVVEQIDDVIWTKLLHNAVVNPVSALTGLTCRELLDDEDLQAFMRGLCMEIIAVMRARGVPIIDEEDPYRPVINSQRALGKNRPSMWQDLVRTNRTEVDAINGAVVVEAERLGLSAPHNRALVQFIHSRERQKFLRKQEIADTLRQAAGAPDEAATARRQFRGQARPIRKAEDGGMPLGRVPLQVAPKLKELVNDYYRDLQTASDDPNRRVAYVSGMGPVEILRAMGLTPYFPENHAALIGASRQTGRYIPRALAEGFSQFASSALACDVGALLVGDSPLVSVYGIDGPPDPDVLVYNTNYGQRFIQWFNYYAKRFQVPVFGLHPPAALDELDHVDLGAASQQMLRLVQQLEEMTGQKLDIDRLAKVVLDSSRAAWLWREILDLAKTVPSPLTFFDMLIHVGPMVLMRGTPEAVTYYSLLKAEIEERVAENVAAVPGERFRFYWEGPPIWCALRPLAELFFANQVAIVASTYCGVFALEGFDPKNPIESLARSYTSVFHNRSDAYKEDYLVSMFGEYGVDGVVYHEGRTAPEHSNVRYGLEVRLRRTAGVQAIVVEADTHDLRLFSQDRLERKLRDFIEMHEAAPAGATPPGGAAPNDLKDGRAHG
jgi:2-dehydropantoate 2-reductase